MIPAEALSCIPFSARKLTARNRLACNFLVQVSCRRSRLSSVSGM